jgi:hypothetical protein
LRVRRSANGSAIAVSGDGTARPYKNDVLRNANDVTESQVGISRSTRFATKQVPVGTEAQVEAARNVIADQVLLNSRSRSINNKRNRPIPVKDRS